MAQYPRMIPALERAKEALVREQRDIDGTLFRLDRRIQLYERDLSRNGSSSMMDTSHNGDEESRAGQSSKRVHPAGAAEAGTDDNYDDAAGWGASPPQPPPPPPPSAAVTGEEQSRSDENVTMTDRPNQEDEEDHGTNGTTTSAAENTNLTMSTTTTTTTSTTTTTTSSSSSSSSPPPPPLVEEPSPALPPPSEISAPSSKAETETTMMVVGTAHEQDTFDREPDAKRRLVVTSVAVPLSTVPPPPPPGTDSEGAGGRGAGGGGAGSVHWGEDWNNEQSSNAAPPGRRSRLMLLSANPEIKQRSRKIFGFMQGYLQKSKTEAEGKTDRDLRRERVESKVEQSIKKDRSELDEAAIQRIQIEKTTQRQQKEKLISQCDRIRDLIELIRKNDKEHQFQNFLRTDTRPTIYFLPRKLNNPANRLVEEQIRISQLKKTEIDEALSSLQKEIPALSEITDLEVGGLH